MAIKAYTHKCMIPIYLHSLFWDTNLGNFDPKAHPDYSIFRVLEYGDEMAVKWLRETFSENEIRRVLCTERRLSRTSAAFWALVYGLQLHDVAALNAHR